MGNGRLYVEDVKRLLRSCDNLPIWWRRDWYIPTVNELWDIYHNKSKVYGLSSGRYLSSTVYGRRIIGIRRVFLVRFFRKTEDFIKRSLDEGEEYRSWLFCSFKEYCILHNCSSSSVFIRCVSK
jgi:hypothetical protein